MAVQSPKITLVLGIDVFWNCKIEKKILRNFQSPLFFYLFPLATALTCEMPYSPKRRLIRERVTLLALMTVHARIVCSQTPVPYQTESMLVCGHKIQGVFKHQKPSFQGEFKASLLNLELRFEFCSLLLPN